MTADPQIKLELPEFDGFMLAEAGILKEDIERIERQIEEWSALRSDAEKRRQMAARVYREAREQSADAGVKLASLTRVLKARKRLLFEFEQESA